MNSEKAIAPEKAEKGVQSGQDPDIEYKKSLAAVSDVKFRKF